MTLDVPQAIAVIGKDRLDNTAVFNVKDAIVGTPGVLIDTKNGGYDARLIIHGAGRCLTGRRPLRKAGRQEVLVWPFGDNDLLDFKSHLFVR
jgi:hypothetical protein